MRCTSSGPAHSTDLTTLSDQELVSAVMQRAAGERHATAELIRGLIEVDRRRLYLAEGFPSLFAYCTGALHYSEHAAFNRIEVARAAARWPQLLTRIEDGSLHLSGARLLAPHLTEENIESALESASFKSKRDIEEVAAALARRSVLVAVAAEQYRLHLTISRQARDTLRQVQALIGHRVPDANEAVIVERALSLLLEKLLQERAAATTKPRPARAPGLRSRRIPAAVRREVWKRDEGRCAFVGRQGRCGEHTRVEYHHVVPYAAGGQNTAANIELRCRAHNVYEAEAYFGTEEVAAAREHSQSTRTRPGGGKTSVAEARRGGSATRPGASPRTKGGSAALPEQKRKQTTVRKDPTPGSPRAARKKAPGDRPRSRAATGPEAATKPGRSVAPGRGRVRVRG